MNTGSQAASDLMLIWLRGGYFMHIRRLFRRLGKSGKPFRPGQATSLPVPQQTPNDFLLSLKALRILQFNFSILSRGLMGTVENGGP